MADKHADIEVRGLPHRIRCEADKAEAFAIWRREVNRYFRNHDERDREDKGMPWNYEIRAELTMYNLSEQSAKELAPGFKSKASELCVNDLVHWIDLARVWLVRAMLRATKNEPLTPQEMTEVRHAFQFFKLSHQTSSASRRYEVKELQTLLGINEPMTDSNAYRESP